MQPNHGGRSGPFPPQEALEASMSETITVVPADGATDFSAAFSEAMDDVDIDWNSLYNDFK